MWALFVFLLHTMTSLPTHTSTFISSLPVSGLPCPVVHTVCGSYAQNCSVVVETQYTIQYKEECGRRYRKVCDTTCKAVIDPGCYQVPTHTPVEVPREVCYNPGGERCDKYPRVEQYATC